MTGCRNGGRVDVGSVTAVSVAVVGVVGTLLSALLTQRAADRSRQRERERAELARERRGELLEVRTCYVALDTATRPYLAALTDQVHALRRDGSGRVRQRLSDARDQHRDVYAEAQPRVPDPVLDLAGQPETARVWRSRLHQLHVRQAELTVKRSAPGWVLPPPRNAPRGSGWPPCPARKPSYAASRGCAPRWTPRPPCVPGAAPPKANRPHGTSSSPATPGPARPPSPASSARCTGTRAC